MTDTEPVFRLRDEFQPESYWPYEYVRAATPILDRLGWLTRPATAEDEDAAVEVLGGFDDLTLDVTDVFPFGLLWAYRACGVVANVPGLDEQLEDWRRWEENDHVGEPFGFLPPLPSSTTDPANGCGLPA